MELGRISESVEKRSVYRTIHTTGYRRNELLDGAGLGADCAIWALEGTRLAGAQGQAQGRDRTVGVRALQYALNRLAASGLLADADRAAMTMTAQLSVSLAELDADAEPYLRELISLTAQAAAEQGVTITLADTCVVPGQDMTIVTASVTLTSQEKPYIIQGKAEPDQEIVMTKWIGLEGTALLAEEYREQLLGRYPLRLIEAAAGFNRYLSVLPEAATAMKSGVSAMQAAREGGIFGSLWRLASKSGVGLVVDLKKIPVKQETIEVCEFFDSNPYELMAGGSLLAVTDRADALVTALEQQGIHAAVIGKTTNQNDRILLKDGEKRYLEPARHDTWYQLHERKKVK